MPVYVTPGIYRRPQPVAQEDIRLVRTDVAGFVGFAERGPLPSPEVSGDIDATTVAVRLTSWKEFQATFGGYIPYGYLAYAVRAFFENGGTTCYVVRVAATHDPDTLQRPRAASFTLPGEAIAEQVTRLAKDANEGCAELVLDYSRWLQAGDLIMITETNLSEFAVVATRLDDATVRLQRKLARKHLAGEAVSRVTGGRLKADVATGQTDLLVDNATDFNEGELVGICGAGVTEFATVAARVDDSTIRLGRKLEADHYAGDVVSKHSSALTVTATSKGNWGNRIRLELIPLEPGPFVEEFALRVTVEPGPDPSRPSEEEFYKRLSLVDDKSAVSNYAPHLVNNRSQFIRLEMKAPQLLVAGGPLASGPVQLEGGRDGLAKVSVQDFTGGFADDAADLRGLRLLEKVDEVAILCAPDAVFEAPPALPKRPGPLRDPCAPPPPPPKPDPVAEDPTAIPRALDTKKDTPVLYRRMIDQCERLRYRVAILDPPDRLSAGKVVDWRDQFFTRFGALYYPWLRVPDPLEIDGPSRHVPPSGHVAGVYAQIDNQFGVQRPPANAPLDFVVDVVEEITSLQQENLNPYGVNALRSFPGRGIRVWGARSLAAYADSDWQFIHVRRLMSMIEKSVEHSTQWAVFEPHNDALRRTLVHSMSVFLEAIWRKGGLKGALSSQGFYVKCDETNNPPEVVDAGQLICQIGVAVAAPMEFLVFELRQAVDSTEIAES